jgi:hypothetical protein
MNTHEFAIPTTATIAAVATTVSDVSSMATGTASTSTQLLRLRQQWYLNVYDLLPARAGVGAGAVKMASSR